MSLLSIILLRLPPFVYFGHIWVNEPRYYTFRKTNPPTNPSVCRRASSGWSWDTRAIAAAASAAGARRRIFPAEGPPGGRCSCGRAPGPCRAGTERWQSPPPCCAGVAALQTASPTRVRAAAGCSRELKCKDDACVLPRLFRPIEWLSAFAGATRPRSGPRRFCA